MKNKLLKNRHMRTKLKRMVDNMNEIILDGRLMVENPHEYIKEQLEFPDYYGNNLDALYDCLGEVYNKTIIIMHSSEVDEKIIATFSDAAEENPYLTLILD